jgi:hypothetical protein
MPSSGAQSESSRRPPRRQKREASIDAVKSLAANGVHAAPAPPIGDAVGTGVGTPQALPRFRIFIVDSGWNSAARQVLHDNFHLLRELQRETPIYLLGRERSIDLLRRFPVLVGKDPIIRVHCEVLRKHRPPGFHGFRLHLGLLKESDKALAALQKFVRFICVHRDSQDLEDDMRKKLRLEGLQGAFEIIAHGDAHSVSI